MDILFLPQHFEKFRREAFPYVAIGFKSDSNHFFLGASISFEIFSEIRIDRKIMYHNVLIPNLKKVKNKTKHAPRVWLTTRPELSLFFARLPALGPLPNSGPHDNSNPLLLEQLNSFLVRAPHWRSHKVTSKRRTKCRVTAKKWASKQSRTLFTL